MDDPAILDVAPEASVLENGLPAGPIVLTLKTKKKGKRRYSKDLKDLQEVERRLARASHRLARAAERGTSDYRKSSLKSARKKKDGALRDWIPNSGFAMSHALKDASPAVYDLAKAASTKGARRLLRQQLRMTTRMLRAWR